MPKHSSPAIAALTCAAVFSLASLPSDASSIPNTSRTLEVDSTIAVTGTSTVELVPDRVRVTVRVEATGQTINEALEKYDGQRLMFEKVLADFEDFNIEQESSGTGLGHNVIESNRWVNGQKEDPTTFYRAREVVSLSYAIGEDRKRALVSVAELVGALSEVDVGLDQDSTNRNVYYSNRDQEPIGPIAFQFSDEAFQKAEDEALQKAFEAARAKAGKLAGVAGAAIGDAIKIGVSKALGRETNLAGSSKKKVTVNVTFEMRR